jgi:hypothetical protein
MFTINNLITSNVKTSSLIMNEEWPDILRSGAAREYYLTPSTDGFFPTISAVLLISGSSTQVELNGLYSLLNIVRAIKSRRMRCARHVARMREGRGVCRVLMVKPEGKRPLGRPRRRLDDNIRLDLQELGSGCEDWIGLAQDRDRWRALVSGVRNLRVP